MLDSVPQMLGLKVCTTIPGYPTFYTVIKVQAGFPNSFKSSSHTIECSKLSLQLLLTHIGLVKCEHDEARFRNYLVVRVVVVKRNWPSEVIVVAVGSSDGLVHLLAWFFMSRRSHVIRLPQTESMCVVTAVELCLPSNGWFLDCCLFLILFC